MRIITKYMIREMIPNYFVGLAFFTIMMLVNEVFRLVKYVVEHNIPFGKVSQLFIFTIPYVLAITIPMAVLMASILTFGRLSSDSEVVALRGSGISLMRIIRPNLMFGVVLFGLTMIFFDTILPWGNLEYAKMRRQIFVRDPMADFEPRQVIRIGGRNLRFERQDPGTKRMYNIYITDREGSVTFARSGEFIEKRLLGNRMFLRFRLYDVSIQETEQRKSKNLLKTYAPVVVRSFVEHHSQMREVRKSARTMTVSELLNKIERDNKRSTKLLESAQKQVDRAKKQLHRARQDLESYRHAHPEEFVKKTKPGLPKRVASTRPGVWRQGMLRAVRFAWRTTQLYRDRFRKPSSTARRRKNLQARRARQAARRHSKQVRRPGRGKRPTLSSRNKKARTQRPKPPFGRRKRPAVRTPRGRPGGRPPGKQPARKRTVKNRSYYERKVASARSRVKHFRKQRELREKHKTAHPGDVYELHKKFALPFACLVFTVIGAPLGMYSRRSGRSMGFGFAIVVMIAYYFMLVLGRGWVQTRLVDPVFSAWMPDIFLGVIGVFLTIKKLLE